MSVMVGKTACLPSRRPGGGAVSTREEASSRLPSEELRPNSAQAYPDLYKTPSPSPRSGLLVNIHCLLRTQQRRIFGRTINEIDDLGRSFSQKYKQFK